MFTAASLYLVVHIQRSETSLRLFLLFTEISNSWEGLGRSKPKSGEQTIINVAIYLAFEKFKTSPTTGADMAEFILSTLLGDKSSSITATNDNSSAVVDNSFNGGLKEGDRTFCERGKLKDSRRTRKKVVNASIGILRVDESLPVPENRFGFQDC